MKNKILIVDDNISYLDAIKKYFSLSKWDVFDLDSGDKMIDLINNKYSNKNKKIANISDFQCLILDHELPVANGNEILREANDKKIQLPPTIILSGYLNNDDVDNYFQLGAVICCQKPVDSRILLYLATLLVNRDFESLLNIHKELSPKNGLAISEYEKRRIHIIKAFKPRPTYKSVSDTVKKREDFLNECFKKSIGPVTSIKYKKIKNPVFVVGRRWNSWYPSYFSVPGGAYVIVMPKYKNKNEVIVIDPGFKSLKILSENLNISVADISTCIISHNHPDHIGGIFEYLACRNTLNKKSHLFCNPTTLEMFLNHRSIEQIDEISINLLEDWDKAKFSKILISGFKTSHNEIGPRNNPRAIEIEFVLRPNEIKNKIVILGDTEFRPEYISLLAKSNIKILVIHIGSAQLKEGAGKHLYIQGTKDLLTGLNLELKKNDVGKKHLLVLISEWGLEHASSEQLGKIGIKNIPDEFEGSPIKDIISCLEKDLDYIKILPADIGLMVDIIDQNIYSVDEENKKYPFEKIHCHIDGDGIKYTKHLGLRNK